MIADVAREIYIEAAISEDGSLRIVTESGRKIAIRKESGQVGFEQVRISEDGLAVGWVGMYPNGATSYPIPLKFTLYSSGSAMRYAGNGLPVFVWRFLNGGKQVAFHQETVHGGLGVHDELRDVASGRLVADYEPERDKDKVRPKWVDELNTRR